MIKKFKFLSLFFLLILTSCTKSLPPGNYLIELELQGQIRPFVLVNEKGNLYIINSNEKIKLKERIENVYDIPPYDAALEFSSFSPLEGHWVRYNKNPEYKVKFNGKKITNAKRFNSSTTEVLNGDYQITIFSNNKETPAIGTFITEDGIIKGSIVTTTGDYRFLEGHIDQNKKLHLYGFDGIFAYIFEAKIESNQFYDGTMWAGKSFKAKFTGKYNPDFKLSYPKYSDILKKENSTLSFQAEDLKGVPISYHSNTNNKVKIIQIFGSWCPNCQDETAYFAKWYPKYKNEIELIALSFERSPNKKHALKSIKKTLIKLKPDYPFYLASVNSEEDIDSIIPEIKKIPAYPTTFILDKKGIVRDIHTGFNGPATGKYFIEFQEKFEKTINKLLKE